MVYIIHNSIYKTLYRIHVIRSALMTQYFIIEEIAHKDYYASSNKDITVSINTKLNNTLI